MSEDWRPATAYAVPLSDLELAKLGMLAQIEAQCRGTLANALKALEQLDVSGWMALESVPFPQLVARVQKAADKTDPTLSQLVRIVSNKHPTVLAYRHQNLHSVWAFNNDVTGGRMAWDLKRDIKLTPETLDYHLGQVAELSRDCRNCVSRVADLIESGVLPEGTSEKGPHIRVKDRWIKL